MLALWTFECQYASMSNPKVSKSEVEPQGKAKGGKARAAKLSAEERQAISKKAAAARWEEVSDVIAGSSNQPVRIGEVEIECYVLDNGKETRILTQASMLEAIGRHKRPNNRKGSDLPPILQGNSISQFVTPELIELAQPIAFRLPGGRRANGFDARVLPELCEVYLKAADAGLLPPNQRHVAARASILVRGLAQLGIIALVDEATGYQEARTKHALAMILEAFIDKELNAWVRTFPEDFYKEMFRLRGLDYESGSVKRPQYFGNLTNDVVYSRLAPGVLDELRVQVPTNAQGRRKHKFFQKLTTNTGYPKLREHLGSVVTLMKLSEDWDDFKMKLDRFHPRYGKTMVLPFDEDSGQGL